MQKTILLVTLAATMSLPFVLSSHINGAEGSAKIALAGQVGAMEDGPMEGVLVSARLNGSTITTTVVSDERGRFGFPAAKVGPGQYAIKIRAVGYELDGPKTVDVTAEKMATADLKLRKPTNIPPPLPDPHSPPPLPR